jgi:prepilin-type N-terminal cleavage/methylation domain-containing protein
MIRARPKPGFSLIELMITLSLTAVVMRLALPAWSGFAGRASVDAISNELSADLALARIEAVRRQAQIIVCSGVVSAGAASCSASTNWAAGRVVYCSDPGATGICCPDGPGTCASGLTQQVLRTRQAVLGGTVKVTGPSASVVFHPTGAVTSTTLPISFTVCKPATGYNNTNVLAERTLSLGSAGQLLALDTTSTPC